MKKTASVLVLLILILIMMFFVSNHLHKPNVKVGIVDSQLSMKTVKRYSMDGSFNLRVTELSSHGDMVVDVLKRQSPNSVLYYACAIGEADSGEIADVIAALEYLKNQGVEVICLSFTTMADNKELHRIIKELTDERVVIVAACLNYSDITTYPAGYPEVLSVSNCKNSNADISVTDLETKNILRNYKWNDCSTSALTAFIAGKVAEDKGRGVFDREQFIEKYNSR